MKIPGQQSQQVPMTSTEQHLRAVAEFGSCMAKFILKHGRAFEPDLLTFKGWTGEPRSCFGNATMLVLTKDQTLTYVEGFVDTFIPIHHAWVAREDGTIIDPTLRLDGRVRPAPHSYFGVPFDSDYLRQFVLKVGAFGLLDGMNKQSINLMMGNVRPSRFLAMTLWESAK